MKFVYAGHSELALLQELQHTGALFVWQLHEYCTPEGALQKVTSRRLQGLRAKGYVTAERVVVPSKRNRKCLLWSITDDGALELERAKGRGRKPGVPARETYRRAPQGMWVGPMSLDVLDSLEGGDMTSQQLAEDIGTRREYAAQAARRLRLKGYLVSHKEGRDGGGFCFVHSITQAGRDILALELDRGRIPGVALGAR